MVDGLGWYMLCVWYSWSAVLKEEKTSEGTMMARQVRREEYDGEKSKMTANFGVMITC
jgi:hypothetical protein